MVSTEKHRDEGIAGYEEARRYAEKHRKFAGLMYRPLLKDLRKLGLSGRYLEIGAGTGFLAATIAGNNPNVDITTIDISPGMVAVAKDYMEERGVQDRVHCLVGDVGDRGLVESLGRFDLVYSTFSVHHWKNPEGCLANMWIAVRDGGVMYVYDLNRVWWLRPVPFGPRQLRLVRGAYSSSEMTSLLQKAGVSGFAIRKHYAGLVQSVMVERGVVRQAR